MSSLDLNQNSTLTAKNQKNKFDNYRFSPIDELQLIIKK